MKGPCGLRIATDIARFCGIVIGLGLLFSWLGVYDTGAFIHHPSNILHTSHTTDTPVFTAWRWSGDIGFDKYQLK